MEFIYVVGPKIGPVKIGISGAPEVRLRALQTSHPKKLLVLAAVPGCVEDEEAAHKFLWCDRTEGEWFRRTKEVRQFIDMLSCGVSVGLTLKRLKHECETMYEQWKESVRLELISKEPPMAPIPLHQRVRSTVFR